MINYVHYDVNVKACQLGTRDAIEGLAEQVAPTSLMAVQNRMALDMLLAEKGGCLCDVWRHVLHIHSRQQSPRGTENIIQGNA